MTRVTRSGEGEDITEAALPYLPLLDYLYLFSFMSPQLVSLSPLAPSMDVGLRGRRRGVASFVSPFSVFPHFPFSAGTVAEAAGDCLPSLCPPAPHPDCQSIKSLTHETQMLMLFLGHQHGSPPQGDAETGIYLGANAVCRQRPVPIPV